MLSRYHILVALPIMAAGQHPAHANKYPSYDGHRQPHNCDDLYIGTFEQLNDVVNEGAVRADFAEAKETFLQSETHSFYVKGVT